MANELAEMNILIVEDDSMNRVIYRVVLIKAGAQVTFRSNGSDIAEYIQGREFDLIILDLMLPYGQSGLNVYEQIRTVLDHDNTPIIAVSASEPATTMPKVRNLGFNGFIGKPIDRNLFTEQIVRVINGEDIWYNGSREIDFE